MAAGVRTSGLWDLWSAGHAGGLPGAMARPVRVTFLGAGSMFCPRLCRDLLSIADDAGGELRLVDVDAGRLDAMRRLAGRMVEQTGRAGRWQVRASVDRRELLPGTDYAICCVEVSGADCVRWDHDIPMNHGVDQCIGDTIGPGGLFKALRTVPVFLEILRDMAELCPGAVMLNYTNPMNMMCLAAGRAMPTAAVVGLCHSVQGTSQLLADLAGVPFDEMDWACAGINHLAWFTRLEHRGQDLYRKVLYDRFEREVAAGIAEAEAGRAVHDDMDIPWDGEVPQPYEQVDLVRKDVCLHFGAFVTESSGHLSEYLPYYRKGDEGRKLLRRGYHGGSRFYASNWPAWRQAADAKRAALLAGEVKEEGGRSWEYASWIIEAVEKGVPFAFHGNVMNRAAGERDGAPLISNLPADGCVEVACVADGDGVRPMRFGALPPQMAHLCAANMAVFDLGATACIERSMDAAVHALLLDPLCQAVCTPRQIRAMALELFEAERAFLPGFG